MPVRYMQYFDGFSTKVAAGNGPPVMDPDI